MENEERLQLLEDIMTSSDLLIRELIKKIVVDMVERDEYPSKTIVLVLNLLRIMIRKYQEAFPELIEDDEVFEKRFDGYLEEYQEEMTSIKSELGEIDVHQELEKIAEVIKEQSHN